MIDTFPRPERDELLYSVVARYTHVEHLQPHEYREVGRKFFFHQDAVVATDFPTRLDVFVQQLPAGYPESAQSLLANHTMFPAVAPILHAKMRKGLEENIINSRYQSRRSYKCAVLNILGARRGLWLCPDCAEAEQRRLGFAYWHRALQLVPHCLAHSRVVCFVDQAGDPYVHGYISADTAYQRLKNSRSIGNISFLAGMAEDARYLLENNRCDTDAWRVRMALGSLRERWRLAVPQNRKGSFSASLLQDLSPSTRQILASIYGIAAEPIMLAKQCKLSPGSLKLPGVLMVTRLLNTSVAQLFAEAQTMPVFDTKWPCQNSHAPCCGKLTIGSFRIVQGRAFFICPECALIYSRSFPPKIEADGSFDFEIKGNYQARRGPAWRSRLVRLWTSGRYDFDRIVKLLGSSRRTLTLIARKAGLPKIKGINNNYHPGMSFAERSIAYRNAVENTVQTLKVKNRVELARICQKEMLWLRLWDRDFIRRILPSTAQLRTAAAVTRRARKEEEMLASFDSMVDSIKALRPPRRVTKKALLNAAGVRVMGFTAHRFRRKWPRTVERAAKLEETREEYAARRARIAMVEMIAAGNVRPSWIEMIKYGGLQGYYQRNQEARRAMARVYKEMLETSTIEANSHVEEAKADAA